MSTSEPRSYSPLVTALVWDNHGCLPLRTDIDPLPLLERYRNAGVNIVSVNIGYADMSWTDHLKVLAHLRRSIAHRPDHYRLVSTVADIRACKSEARLGVLFDVEGMYPVQDNLDLVQTFYELGVRWMLIAYNRSNAAGGGCLDVDKGLTAVGRAIIDELERVGMALCLSHTGARTAAEALDYSRNPVIFSHSNPYGDIPHERNISDDLMRLCARKGGVVGLSGFGPYLGPGKHHVQNLLRQLRYAVDLIGADHVGLGLDYVFDLADLEGCVRKKPEIFPLGFDTAMQISMVRPEELIAIAEGLARDNLTDSQIGNILGENWFRLAARIWK
jgi:membrane dipeptidase